MRNGFLVETGRNDTNEMNKLLSKPLVQFELILFANAVCWIANESDKNALRTNFGVCSLTAE